MNAPFFLPPHKFTQKILHYLEKTGIKVENLHPNFKACPKYSTCWVYLDEQGNIAGVEAVHPSLVQGVRKWEKAYGVSFPAFNMPPLLKAGSEKTQEQIKNVKKHIEKGVALSAEELPALIDSCETLWGEKTLRKLADCLTKSLDDISRYFDAVPEAYLSIVQLISRTRAIKVNAFKEQLIDALKKKLKDAPEADLIEFLFFYSGKTPKNFQIILELSDKDHLEYPATHQEVQRWMNKRLLAETQKVDGFDLDAFGNDATGKDAKFPPVGFKNALGNVILRAMNQESPCQTRYGMIDYHSFPAGEEIRKKMKGALEWLGDKNRKGKTWCDLSHRLGKPMLLFAYPSAIPQDLPDLAGLMGDVDDEAEEINDDRFAALAEKVTISLSGMTKEAVDSEVRVFVLSKKKGDARNKVIANCRYSAEHIIQSARLWQEGCRNIPTIEVRSFGKKKGDRPVWRKPLAPFPAEVAWCLNTVWMRQGTHAEGAHGFTVNDALCLLLGHGIELNQVSRRALNSVLRHSVSLLIALGQAHAQGLVHKADRKYSKQPLLLPSILGLLLHKLNQKKGDIMTSPAFLVGRFLNLADSLHLEYCRHVRNNSIPPQLVGNALMASALETPEKALSMMAQRVLPYQAWARTTKGEEAGLARFFLKNLGEVSEQLKDVSLPKQTNDSDKSQMLLGYLARAKQD